MEYINIMLFYSFIVKIEYYAVTSISKKNIWKFIFLWKKLEA